MFRFSLQTNKALETENPAHGSGWIVQIQPTTDKAVETENPTHGSGWIVQIQPTTDKAVETENPTPREWVDCSDPAYAPESPSYSDVLSHALISAVVNSPLVPA